MKIATAAFALCLLSATAAAPNTAVAYDPCQRALEDRAIKRDAMNRYISNQCPASARNIPADCKYPQRGWELLNELHAAMMRVQRECNS